MFPSLVLAIIASNLDHRDAVQLRCVNRFFHVSVPPVTKPYWHLGIGDLLVKTGDLEFVKVVKLQNNRVSETCNF